MTVTKEAVVEKLRSIRGQNMESDIVSLGLVSEIFIADSKVFFSVTVPAEKAREMEPLRAAAEAAVKSLPGVDSAVVALTAERKGGGMEGMKDALRNAGKAGGVADQMGDFAEKMGVPGGKDWPSASATRTCTGVCPRRPGSCSRSRR